MAGAQRDDAAAEPAGGSGLTDAWGLLETAPDAMLVVDEAGRIVLVNAAAESLFGYPRAELLGESIEFLVPDSLREGHARHRQGYVEHPEVRPMGARLELSARRKDGSELPVEISLSPFRSGDRLLISSAIRDVTDRRKAQRDLRRAKDEAEEASRAKTRFLAAASHDLRQPLEAARLYLEVLRSDLDAPSETVDKIGLCMDNLRGLLDRLLNISRLDGRSVVPNPRVVELREILDRVATEVEPLAERKGLRFLRPATTAFAFTDPSFLERILKNLLLNAVRYTDTGGVLLGVRRRGADLAVQVWDTGQGIPEEERELIFEEFYRAQNQTRRGQENFGLGLAIVRRLAELLDHRVEVRSIPGKGSCFEVVLPRAEPPVREPER